MSGRFSLLLRRCTFPFVLFSLFLTAFAQKGVLTAVTPSAQTGTTDRASAVQPETSAGQTVLPDSSGKEQPEQWEQEMLRDPFWPVGFFPEGWQKKTAVQGAPDVDVSGWKAAAGKIRISGTSRLGERTAAIVNGELKSTGDQVEVLFEGKTYQWQIVGIDTDGRVQLKKLGTR